MTDPRHIIIAAPPKTGTTALYYLIFNSLQDAGGGECRGIFEEPPYTYEPGDEQRHIVAKAVVNPGADDVSSFADFDRKVTIVRDPRDMLVSRVMYGLGYHSPYDREDLPVARMFALLRRKESAPAEVSLLDILRFDRELKGADTSDDSILDEFLVSWRCFQEFYAHHPEYHRLRYEDLVDRRLAELEAYLGFPLTASPDVAEKHRRVVRTRAHGQWRHWFREEDVALFRPVFDPFLAEHGYDTDWELADPPVIPPEHCSAYFYRLFSEKRALILRPVSVERLEELAAAE